MIALDTDVLIDVLRGQPTALGWFASAEQLVLPGYVMMELVQGCNDRLELARLQRATRDLPLVWPTAGDCDLALASFARLRLAQGVGMIDCLIAHTAIGHGLRLATFNARHYAAIAGLATFVPYRRLR